MSHKSNAIIFIILVVICTFFPKYSMQKSEWVQRLDASNRPANTIDSINVILQRNLFI